MNARPLILIVEDNPSNLKRLKLILQARPGGAFEKVSIEGFDFDTAQTVEQAEELLLEKGHDYEAVLLDMELPRTLRDLKHRYVDDQNGRALLEKMRQEFDATVVIITSYPSTDNFVHALQQGAVDFIIRPLTTREDEALVFVRMEHAVGRSREARMAGQRLQHEYRIAAIEHQRDHECVVSEKSSQIHRIGLEVAELRKVLSKRIGLDPVRDAGDPICRTLQKIDGILTDQRETDCQHEAAANTSSYGEVDIAGELKEMVNALRPCYALHGVNLEIDCPEELCTMTFGDDLRDVIAELVFGTLEMSPRGSTVSLSCTQTGKPEDGVVSIVRRGDPVPDTVLAATDHSNGEFDPKWRGLSLLRRIVSNIGGKLNISNESDQVRVTVRIPLVSDE